MGIQDLFTAIRAKCPQVLRTEKLDAFSRRRFALDMSNLLYKSIAQYKERWLDYFMNLFVCLKKNRITPLLIFDGKAPAEKEGERTKRRESKQRLRDRIVIYQQRLEYLNSLSADEVIAFENKLKREVKKDEDYMDIEDFDNKSDDKSQSKKLERDPQKMTRSELMDKIQRLQGQDIQLSDDHFEIIKDLANILGYSIIMAEGEAEAFASHLCMEGKVAAVVSEDGDALTHGCPILIRKIAMDKGSCEAVVLHEVLDGMGMDYDTFVDYCIMCGTDYSPRVKGMGWAKCYEMVHKYGDLDDIEKLRVVDTSVYNHKRIRSIFKGKESDILKRLPDLRLRPADLEGLQKFLKKHDCHISFFTLKKLWSQ